MDPPELLSHLLPSRHALVRAWETESIDTSVDAALVCETDRVAVLLGKNLVFSTALLLRYADRNCLLKLLPRLRRYARHLRGLRRRLASYPRDAGLPLGALRDDVPCNAVVRVVEPLFATPEGNETPGLREVATRAEDWRRCLRVTPPREAEAPRDGAGPMTSPRTFAASLHRALPAIPTSVARPPPACSQEARADLLAALRLWITHEWTTVEDRLLQDIAAGARAYATASLSSAV